MNSAEKTDRYISFCGIDCDRNANELIDRLKQHLKALPAESKWRAYFEMKFEQQQRMAYDNLFYVGCQVNALYEFFDSVQDRESRALLQQVEEECC